jgi:uncharacterized protein YbjT (DUF2867 family)
MSILVTGATGTIGIEILRLFSQNPQTNIKALVRDTEKAELVSAYGAEPVIGAFEDQHALVAALQGVATVILITPANPHAEEHASQVIGAAVKANAQKIVRISAVKADPSGPTNNTRAHGKTETEISQSGLRYVFLRPNLFMQNMFLALDEITQKGQFSFAMGEGKMGMIDTRDIAACAVQCALPGRWDGQTLELTGPEAISYTHAARVLSELLKKTIAYVPIPPEDMYATIDGAGWGEWMAALARDYGRAYAAGWADFTTGNVQEITGSAPRSFRAFASDVLLQKL